MQLELSHFRTLAQPYLDRLSATPGATLANDWPADDQGRLVFSQETAGGSVYFRCLISIETH